MAGGLPSEFTQDMADKICDRLALGESLRSITADEAMPASSTVFKWLNQYPEFAEQYARAREAQADTLFDEMLDIADDGSNDWMESHSKEGENIGWRENGEAIRRSQLRIDARKWMAGKLRPKKYGDAAMVKLADANGEKIPLDDVSKFTRLAAIAQQLPALLGQSDDASDDAG